MNVRLIILLAALLGAVTPARAGVDARLRGNVIVESDRIVLGDLFEGVVSGSERIVAAAPAPGESLTFSARQIARIAARNELDWQSLDPRLQIQVTRAGTAVRVADIKIAIEEALAEAGVDGRIEVEVRTQGGTIFVPSGTPPTVAVEDLETQRANGAFTATLLAPANAHDGRRFAVSGRYLRLVEIPVLNRSVANGEVIGSDDIDWLALPQRRIGRTVALAAEDIIGRTPRRQMSPGHPLRARDFLRPVTVEKGALVTMALRDGPLLVTATGQALDSGSVGDVIRVRNSQSRNVVQGTVSGPATVIVSPRGPRLAVAE